MFTGHKEIDDLISNKLVGKKPLVYAGFDPTGDGLHLGHLAVLSILAKFQNKGIETFALLGTGTAFIGDPTGKNEMRKMLTSQVIEDNVIGIESDISRTIPGIKFIRNDWLRDINLQDFMREAGSRIPLNDLLNLSIVRDRLESGNGITLMEAIYPVLQGWDMVVMARKAKEQGFDTIIQVGGKDQTGNVSMGIHLVNRLVDDIEAIGVFSDLIVDGNGTKMGKTSGNAVWLNPEKTDDLLFFDTIMSVPDSVIPSMIDVLMPEIDKNANIMIQKKVLAIGITGWVRGNEAVDNILTIKEKGFDEGKIRTIEVKHDPEKTIDYILKEIGLVSSLSEGRRLLDSNGIKVNGETITDRPVFGDKGSFIISKGKKNHIKVIFV